MKIARERIVPLVLKTREIGMSPALSSKRMPALEDHNTVNTC